MSLYRLRASKYIFDIPDCIGDRCNVVYNADRRAAFFALNNIAQGIVFFNEHWNRFKAVGIAGLI
jgi:hypothetical protein